MFRRCPLKVQGIVFSTDLIELLFKEIDLILGMDLLMKHRVSLDCYSKKVTLKVGDVKEVVMVDRDYLFNVISALEIENLVCKGCGAYLAYVHGTSVEGSSVEGIRTVKDFLNVFLKQLLELPSLLTV